MRGLLTAIAAVSLMVCGGSIRAASVQNDYSLSYKCVVANQLCFVVRAPAGDLSPTKRVDTVNDRLAYILGNEPLHPDDIRIHYVNREPTIFVGNKMLVDVTPADAQADRTTTRELAKKWVARLQSALPQARPQD